MPLLDFTEHRGTQGILRRFRKKYPVLNDNDQVNSVILSADKKAILVMLYEDIRLPRTFEGVEVKSFI